MSSPMLIATGAIVADTFREAFARKIFWGLFGLSTAMIAFFLFVLKIDVVAGSLASVSLFGQTAGGEVDVRRLVQEAQAGVATTLYYFEMLLAVFASAGLIPSVLEPGRIELLLSKPVSRTHLLMGRFAGNLLVVGSNIVYLVLSVWLILGCKTEIWMPGFLFAIVTALFAFAVLLAVVILVGVLLESTALAVIIPVGVLLISMILATHETMYRLLGSQFARNLWYGLYQVFPKFYEIGRMTLDVARGNRVEALAPVWTTAAFGAAMLGLSVHVFRRRDF